jgi:hypothetical protein
MAGAPIGALDANFTQPDDPFQAAIQARQRQQQDVQSEMEHLKNDKLSAIGRGLSAAVAGYHRQDPSRAFSAYNQQLDGLQKQQRQLGAEMEDLTLKRAMQDQQRGNRYGQYNPRDYTTESWAQFLQTEDPSVLQRYQEFGQGGVRYARGPQGELVPLVGEDTRREQGDIQAQIAAREEELKQLRGQIGRGVGEAAAAEDVAGARSRVAREVESGKQSVKKAGDIFEQVGTIRSSLPNYDEAISAIDDDAMLGRVQNLLPSFRESTQRFENAANRLGLDVIAGTTFGALSEAEMNTAMETAVPRGMTPEATRRWLVDKRKAQEKLATELEDAAIFFQRGGTQADWAERGRRLRGEASERDPVQEQKVLRYNPQTGRLE